MTVHRIEATLDCSADAVADLASFVFERLAAEGGEVRSFVSEPEQEQDQRSKLAAVPSGEGSE